MENIEHNFRTTDVFRQGTSNKVCAKIRIKDLTVVKEEYREKIEKKITRKSSVGEREMGARKRERKKIM